MAEEEKKEEVVEKRPRRTKNEEEVPLVSSTEYSILELITLSEEIAGVPNFVAEGAIRHAELDKRNDKMTTDAFKKACKAFESAPAFKR